MTVLRNVKKSMILLLKCLALTCQLICTSAREFRLMIQTRGIRLSAVDDPGDHRQEAARGSSQRPKL